MPDLLTLNGPQWALTIWSRDIEPARQQLKNTLLSRGVALPSQEVRLTTQNQPWTAQFSGIPLGVHTLKEPVFFENRIYEFEFKFLDGVVNQKVRHRLNAVQDAFRNIGNSLRGGINFGNDIGWFRLAISYESAGRQWEDTIAFEVSPTKMDMAADLNRINASIDAAYPLWRFSFAQKTDQELSRSRQPHERFPLLWLALFQSLRRELYKQVRVICIAPHARLLQNVRRVRIDRLTGKVGARLEEGIHEALLRKDNERLFDVSSRRLSVDTPENRFVLMVLRHTNRELSRFAAKARQHNGKPEKERVSEAFFNEITVWQKGLEQLAAHPMFTDVGVFEGMERESLVLQQRAGYAGVYRVWQQLKQYLDIFGRQASISMKSVAELYEVWCLLEIRRMLLELGFKESNASVARLELRGLEKELEGGIGASFRFTRDDGLKVRLAHEPLYGKPGSIMNSIYSWNAVQKPDIVLEVTFPNGELIHWIFDAKYRVDTSTTAGAVDLVPDDALNQMHRYRDALIMVDGLEDGKLRKSRPFIGAFVLYPGWFPEQLQKDASANPYAKAIDAVGIGAFPALPGQDNGWLREFLGRNLALQLLSSKYPVTAPDQHLVQEAVRISPSGLTLKRRGDLIFVAPAGPARKPDYLKSFRSGAAKWYHVRDEALNREHIPVRVMNDITHVAVAVPGSPTSADVWRVFEVSQVRLCQRDEISEAQAGTNLHGSGGNYWLFSLGDSFKLPKPVTLANEKVFRFGICTKADLVKASRWQDVACRYTYIYAP